ncbi:hypothetical protein PLICRDRAFT_46093 [Plicaturopsis crispa FD-325 SS-3]|uniref:Unplaced genomic scaffold PLICRscaffold_18, whole genome shotgun sequence n=1 Tax=Plicaturopsis crispa FD-325 SS-3 TaxID=944288 RepID=A0A0C9SR22_PLICR|nr:hypothetical protein PLICRDRAFT_46093 [Plicaturopsis crispa FD-325 SS-3]
MASATFHDEKVLPCYTPEMTIYPITSQSTSRYYKSSSVKPRHLTLAAGPTLYSDEPGPQYLPPHWTAHTHPEGQLYFYRASSPRIVTEAYLYRPEIMDRVSTCTLRIEKMLLERQKTMSDNMEIFLELDVDASSCGYYMIDHNARTEFWLDSLTTEELYLPPAVSKSHLQLKLEELYWTHLETFPMHYDGLRSRDLDTLISIYSHALADRMTSELSTFTHSAEKCRQILDLLRSSRPSKGDHLDGYTTCYVARFWSTISEHKFIIHSGQESTRLNRNQAILEAPTAERPWLSRLSRRLTFGLSAGYLTGLNNSFTDDLVYDEHWHKFLGNCRKDWASAVSWGFYTLMLTVIVAFTPGASLSLTGFALLFNGGSVLSALLLLFQHEKYTVPYCTSEVATYLTAWRSPSSGLLSLAVIFSTPRTLLLWGYLSFMVQALFVPFKALDLYLAIACISFPLLIFAGAWWWASRTRDITSAEGQDVLPQHMPPPKTG